MASLLEVAARGNVGDVVQAIYAQCHDLEAKHQLHLLAKPYFETILRRFNGQTLRYSLVYGLIKTLDGRSNPAYLLTMTRADHLVTKWALFVNEQDRIIRIAEQDPELPTNLIVKH